MVKDRTENTDRSARTARVVLDAMSMGLAGDENATSSVHAVQVPSVHAGGPRHDVDASVEAEGPRTGGGWTRPERRLIAARPGFPADAGTNGPSRRASAGSPK